jgi:hypothetical protein
VLRQFSRSYLSVPVFVSRAYRALETFPAEAIRARCRAGPKELVEEILPLTALLKHLERPPRLLRCKYVAAKSQHDARIRFAGREVALGFLRPEYFVEITTANSPTDHLRREALNLYGTVFGDPNIRAEGSRRKGTRQIINRATAVDAGANLRNSIEWTTQRILDKGTKSYPQPCILLVNLEPARPLRINEWPELIANTAPHINKAVFPHAYIADWQAGLVFPLGAV